MNLRDKRRKEAAFVRGLPNFEQIRTATARDLHYPGDVVGLFSEEFIVYTPMNLNPPVSYMMLSRFDYVQEHVKFLHGGATWDDTSSNKARTGDLFAFAFYQPAKNVDNMKLFKIVDIRGPENRRPNWVISEHANRRVLLLSKYLGRVQYSAFAAAKGYKIVNESHYPFVRGTMRTKWPKELAVELQGEIKEENIEKEEVKEEAEEDAEEETEDAKKEAKEEAKEEVKEEVDNVVVWR